MDFCKWLHIKIWNKNHGSMEFSYLKNMRRSDEDNLAISLRNISLTISSQKEMAQDLKGLFFLLNGLLSGLEQNSQMLTFTGINLLPLTAQSFPDVETFNEHWKSFAVCFFVALRAIEVTEEKRSLSCIYEKLPEKFFFKPSTSVIKSHKLSAGPWINSKWCRFLDGFN